MNGAEYMVRGLGYLRSVADLENVPVATKNGTPVLLRDLGSVWISGRRCAAELPIGRRRGGRWRHCGHAVRYECA